MQNDSTTTGQLDGLLQPFGLILLGSLPVTDEDGIPALHGNLPVRQLLLVGNGGSSLWPVFSHSAEFADGEADPLDRWSVRVGNELAANLGGRAIFPFDGPPFPPFLSWAEKTGTAVPSRLSIFLHQRFGLWHAYRFALALPELLVRSPGRHVFESPCLDCADKPCLGACPVDAFAGPSYRQDLCKNYLVSDAGNSCRARGCQARRACPVGRQFTYVPEQARFHMEAFVNSGCS